MYQKILVPLDGSELAECVLPHVKSIATGCNVQKVVFMRVVEPFHVSGAELLVNDKIAKQIDSEIKARAEEYLKRVASQIQYNGVDVKTEVATGNAAESLVDYASKNGVDLIILATHGRSGVKRWVWGSVADRLIRSASVPVLMVRAPGCVPSI